MLKEDDMLKDCDGWLCQLPQNKKSQLRKCLYCLNWWRKTHPKCERHLPVHPRRKGHDRRKVDWRPPHYQVDSPCCRCCQPFADGRISISGFCQWWRTSGSPGTLCFSGIRLGLLRHPALLPKQLLGSLPFWYKTDTVGPLLMQRYPVVEYYFKRCYSHFWCGMFV